MNNGSGSRPRRSGISTVNSTFEQIQHYGKDVKFSLSWPYDTVVIAVHNIDFHQTMNAMYFTRGKIEHK